MVTVGGGTKPADYVCLRDRAFRITAAAEPGERQAELLSGAANDQGEVGITAG